MSWRAYLCQTDASTSPVVISDRPQKSMKKPNANETKASTREHDKRHVSQSRIPPKEVIDAGGLCFAKTKNKDGKSSKQKKERLSKQSNPHTSPKRMGVVVPPPPPPPPEPIEVSSFEQVRRTENNRHCYRRGSKNAAKSPYPTFDSHGFKVTVLDEALKVFVIDLVPKWTCELIRQLTDSHVQVLNAIGRPEHGWRSLYTYTKMDIPTCEVRGLPILMHNIMFNIAHVIGDMCQTPGVHTMLRPRTWKEPHLLMYQKNNCLDDHTGVELHFDGSDWTWSLMLSEQHEYEGGGTYIHALKKTIVLSQGQVLCHPGELYHKGIDITGDHSERRLVVCFMDGFKSGVSDFVPNDTVSREYEHNRVYL